MSSFFPSTNRLIYELIIDALVRNRDALYVLVEKVAQVAFYGY